MNLVDYVHFIFGCRGRAETTSLTDLSYIIYAVVRCGINLNYIHYAAVQYAPACRAFLLYGLPFTGLVQFTARAKTFAIVVFSCRADRRKRYACPILPDFTDCRSALPVLSVNNVVEGLRSESPNNITPSARPCLTPKNKETIKYVSPELQSIRIPRGTRGKSAYCCFLPGPDRVHGTALHGTRPTTRSDETNTKNYSIKLIT